MRCILAALLPLTLVACGSRPDGAVPDPGLPAPGPTADVGPAARPPLREAVDALVAPLLDGEWVVGLAVGLVTPGGDLFAGYGRAGADGRTPDENTVFELGSVAKVFTALLLARDVADGRRALDQPLAELLPDGVRLRERDGHPLTLLHLATHTSGLPRMPDDFAPADPSDPYADLTWDGILACLSRFEPTRDPGTVYEYSNLAAGLLGDVLACQAGTSYEALLRERVLEPLGLRDTSVTLDEGRRARLAEGHDVDGNPVPPWTFGALAGAGALRSTAADLVRFLHRQLEPGHDPLGEALALTHVLRHDDPDGSDDVALGWHVGSGGRLWHNGGTGGFHAFVAFDPSAGVGVAVLANTGSFVVDAVGPSLLGLLVGEPRPLELTPTVPLAPEQLDRYVGVYELEPETLMTVRRDDGRLLAEITGQAPLRIWPETETLFHWRVVEADVRFDLPESGPATGLTIVQDGAETAAPRLADPDPM
ncbi:MAG: serine hydrolase [Deltaproteobacteria bacterium]|nr:serine hydrolase [Deltaproteobacteria bacterium]